MKNIYFLLLILLGVQFAGHSQVAKDSELFLQLKGMDSLLFEEGFNKCNFDALDSIVSEDLEFYHDQSGLSKTKAQFLTTIKENICASPDKKPIRKLESKSLEVFPLYNNGELYGAIQEGEHNFYMKEPGKEMYFTSTARFIHLWMLEDGNWLLKRVLSYDHKTPEK